MTLRPLTLLALLFLLQNCRPPLPDQAPAYRIAYNVLTDTLDNYDIYTMNMDGSDKSNITRHPDVAWTYIARGDRIYFLSDRDTCSRCFRLYELNADGEDIRMIYSVRLADSWMGSRDQNREMIVCPHPSVDSAFHIISSSGQLIQRVVIPLPFARDPNFTPDGQTILFRGGERPSKRDSLFNEGIYSIRPDGTGLTRLTRYPGADTTAKWHDYHAGPPIVYPSGDFFTYQSMQAGKYSLYATSITGDSTWKLTRLPQEEGWHSWSPDGKWLAIETFDPNQTQFGITLMGWPDQQAQLLTDSSFIYQQCPVFVLESKTN